MMQEFENMSFEDRLKDFGKFEMFNLAESWFRHLIGCHWEIRNYIPLPEELRSEIISTSGSYLDIFT